MLTMTLTPAALSRVVLLERRDTVAPRDRSAPKVRRYRLARVALEGRPPADGRYAHLRGAYD